MMLLYEGLISRLKKAQNEDAEVQKILNLVKQNQARDYVIRGGLLFREVDDHVLLVVLKGMHSQIIRQAHERGHFL